MSDLDTHKEELQDNFEHWNRKPVLRAIYRSFYSLIAERLAERSYGNIAELGSGAGDIRVVIPDCIRTDIFESTGIDQIENAYSLSFESGSLSNLILFDVFHHLRYPGSALREFHRVLADHGRLILFEPCVSLFGLLVYGPLHHEPLGLKDAIEWDAPTAWDSSEIDYYAAQGNASRLFLRGEYKQKLIGWGLKGITRISAISYVLSGGYSKPQLYPGFMLPFMRLIDRLCDLAPGLFATRLLVVLEKHEG